MLVGHGRRKRGYAGDLTPRTIYVEGILICISPRKPNSHANCMQHVLRCSERQSDGSEYKKTLRRSGLRHGPPLRELTALPQTPWLVGRGWLSPPQESHPHSRPFGPRLFYPHSKISSDAHWLLFNGTFSTNSATSLLIDATFSAF